MAAGGRPASTACYDSGRPYPFPTLDRRLTTPRATTKVRRPLFYGWRIVAAAFGSQILHSSLLFLSQGFYVVEYGATFGWSRGAISWAFGLVRLEAGLLGPVQGWMIDRFGPRPVMRIGAVLFGGGFILLSRIETLWQLFAVMALVAIGSSLAGFLTVHVAIAHWFVRKRAMAMGLASAGFAAGAIFVPLVGWSIAALGWRPTAVISGVLILAVGLPAAQVFRRQPQDMGLAPDGDPPLGPEAERAPREERRPPAASTVDFTLREAVRDRSFWLISIGHGMALLGVGTIPTHLVPHLVERNGWETVVAGLMFPAIMVMQIIGQLGGGFLGDRYSKRLIAAFAMLGHGAAMILLAFSTTPAALAGVAVLHGLAWGARGPLMIAIRADYFGARNLGIIAGWSTAITMSGSIVGSVYAGTMHDRYGDYTTAFWTIGVVTIASSLFFLLARPPPAPVRAAHGSP